MTETLSAGEDVPLLSAELANQIEYDHGEYLAADELEAIQTIATGRALVKSAADEREREERIERLEQALLEVDEYLSGRADADWPSGADHPTPNEEMRLQTLVLKALEPKP